MGLVITSQKEFLLEEDLKIKLNHAFVLICNEERIKQCSINVRIMDDKEMQELNKKFRGKDASTNVLSFTNLVNDKTFVEASLPCLLYTSPSPRDATLSRMPSSA